MHVGFAGMCQVEFVCKARWGARRFQRWKLSVCNKLASFKLEVAAQTGRKISTTAAAWLNGQVDEIAASVGCAELV